MTAAPTHPVIGRWHMALLFALLISVVSRPARAQSTWDAYSPGELVECESANPIHSSDDHNAVSEATTEPTPQYFISTAYCKRRSRVVFAGLTRALPPARAAFLNAFMTTTGKSDMIPLYTHEAKFAQGGNVYWIPFQTKPLQSLLSETKDGDAVDVYALWIGGFRRKGLSTWETAFIGQEWDGPYAPPKPQPLPVGPRLDWQGLAGVTVYEMHDTNPVGLSSLLSEESTARYRRHWHESIKSSVGPDGTSTVEFERSAADQGSANSFLPVWSEATMSARIRISVVPEKRIYRVFTAASGNTTDNWELDPASHRPDVAFGSAGSPIPEDLLWAALAAVEGELPEVLYLWTVSGRSGSPVENKFEFSPPHDAKVPLISPGLSCASSKPPKHQNISIRDFRWLVGAEAVEGSVLSAYPHLVVTKRTKCVGLPRAGARP